MIPTIIIATLFAVLGTFSPLLVTEDTNEIVEL